MADQRKGGIARRYKVRTARWWRSLNVSLMPPGYSSFRVWLWCDDYGDVVIWIGRVWISWNWGHKWPKANRCPHIQIRQWPGGSPERDGQ